ncbi:hypothetical protein V8E53_013089 [Lactarius tabidus]
MQSGLGHQGSPSEDGSMAIFCPACPQPGINLPDDWKIKYNPYEMLLSHLVQLICTFIMDGNFSAEHMKCRSGEQDVPLSSGMAFMACLDSYHKHLQSGKEITQISTCNTYKAIELANSSRPHLDITGIGVTTCCHGFFVPTLVVDFQKGERQINMDYSLCKALSYNMESIPIALVMYDIMCQYKVHLKERVQRSPELSIPDSLELRTGIGLFHIHGHQDSCIPCFSPSYIPGAKQVDGEIIETLWAPLNNVSWSICGMTLAHCQEVLDAHMNHSNWKKMVRIGQRLQAGLELSAEAFQSLSLHLEKHTQQWLTQDQHAQINRNADPSVMDMYDTATAKGPSPSDIQEILISEEGGDPLAQGQTSWIASALRYDLRIHGAKHTSEEAQIICNWQDRIQKLIDKFEHQADGFILHQHNLDIPNLSSIHDYNEYDNAALPEGLSNPDAQPSRHSAHCSSRGMLDGSGMNDTNPEDFPIPLPSSAGWDWCVTHQVTSLAAKEAQLCVAQANQSIHKIRLALGFKSAIFHTQVRSANSQQKKTRAWKAVKSVETTVHENACIYNAYQSLCPAFPSGPDLLKLLPKDLHVATLVLGSEKTGQCNKQQSWIWSFGQTTEDDGTWMDEFERVHWLRAKAQFERWMEEQNSIHNEADWIPAYFHSKAEAWKVLMGIAAQGVLKGHEAYASHQMYAWEELSRSSTNSHSPIKNSLVHHYDAESPLNS